MPTLYHISEEADIDYFEPRSSKYTEENVVWGISEEKLPNYLLPRECPRVTFFAAHNTNEHDRAKFLHGSKRVIALEHAWYARIVTCQLFAYTLPAKTFRLHDENAGYYVSAEPLIPLGVTHIPDLIQAQFNRQVELRFLPDLWPLAEAVAASSLGFSIIRMRNAQPRVAPDR